MTEETLKPVAWTWTDATGCVHMAADRPDIYAMAATVAQLPEPLYSAAGLAEKDRRITELRDGMEDLGSKYLQAKFEAARLRAILAEAREVVEAFADKVRMADDRAVNGGYAPSFDVYECNWVFTFGHLRAARALAEKLEKEKADE